MAKTINRKQKGNRYEREVRDLIKRHTGFDARRGQQFSGSPDSPDVICKELPLHIECKHQEALNIYKAMDQARRDCGSSLPCVIHRRNKTKSLITMDFVDFMALFNSWRVEDSIQN